MNVKITTFTNPFSFFCYMEDLNCYDPLLFDDKAEVNFAQNKEKTDEFHGQYVAVLWKNKWVRGVVSMESQFQIWLIDYGIYIRPNEKHVFKDLPPEYRKSPTKIFEASIHGVVPVDKDWLWLEEDCKLSNKITTTWTPGSIDTVQELLKGCKTYFNPVALLTTQHNHVVLGDLYLKIN